ncbi:MAG TPA: nucleoside triphosphate pyrophosphohydrolase [Hyphomicrobiaceae bacterium]|nr:nucleoside triphosphate pyrophosphohydrolase [Hyphomicrobiaceae bacterium]
MDQNSPTLAASQDVRRLIEIMAALRTPVTGCPWDLEQDFASIAPYTIEEAYEVADAIARHDLADLREELGDLLLQVVYHARLAEEEGAFAFGDVVEGITEKMIRRHPHVFGDAEARTAGMAKGAWEKIKAEERAAKAAERARLIGSHTTAGVPSQVQPSLLADVPLGLPSLTRAIKLQEKAARVGFDWPSLAPVLAKMKEELAELEAVALAADPRGPSPTGEGAEPAARQHIEEEFGDLLFVMANVARHLSIDPETALRKANDKFRRRFAHIEAQLAARGRTPEQSTLAEMDALWDEAKARERGG